MGYNRTKRKEKGKNHTPKNKPKLIVHLVNNEVFVVGLQQIKSRAIKGFRKNCIVFEVILQTCISVHFHRRTITPVSGSLSVQKS